MIGRCGIDGIDGIDGSEGAILGSDDVIVDYYKSSADSAEVTNR